MSLASHCLIACLALGSLPAWSETAQPPVASDERAHAAELMAEAANLARQNTAEKLGEAITKYQEALQVWRTLGEPSKQVEALIDLATARFYLHETDQSMLDLQQAGDVAKAAGSRADQAMVLVSQARLHDSLGDESKALDEAGESRHIFQSLGDQADEALVLMTQAPIHQKLHDTEAAIEAYEQCLALFRATRNRQGEAIAILRAAQLNNLLNRPEGFEKAVNYFTLAAPLFEATSDKFNLSYVLWGLGTANDRLGRNAQAREAYVRALPFFVESKDVAGQARILLSLGEDEGALQNLEKAAEYYQRALPLFGGPGDEASRGRALMGLGKVQEGLEQPAKAMESYGRAISDWQASGDKSMEATAYLKIGMVRFGAHDAKGALSADSAALEVYKAAGDRAGQASTLVGMATAYAAIGDYKKSLDAALQSASLSDGSALAAQRAVALSAAGDAASALHDNAKALGYLEQARVLNENNPAEKAGALAAMGEVYSQMGDQVKALKLLEEALAIQRSFENQPASNKILNSIGLTYSAMGRKAEALALFEKTLADARERQDSQQEAVILSNLARSHQGFGDLDEAAKLYLQAVALIRRSGDRYQEAITLANLGMAFDALGDEAKAFEALNQALAIARELNDRHREANTLNSLALIYSKTGDPEKALETFTQIGVVFADFEDLPGKATTLNNLGAVYRGLGAIDRAKSYFQQALDLYEKLDDDDGRALTFNNLAVVAQSTTDEQPNALYWYGRALKLAEKLGNRTEQASLLSGMGVASSENGDEAQAVAQLTRSLEIARRTRSVNSEALALHNLATVQERRGDLKQALGNLQRALGLWRQIRRADGEAKSLSVMARIELNQGDLKRALGHAEVSIRVNESLRGQLRSEDLRASWLATALSAYEIKIAILMRLHELHRGDGYDAQAFETSERARARSLLDLLSESHVNIRQGIDPQLLDHERRIEHLLSAKASQQGKLAAGEQNSAELAKLEHEVEDLSSEYDRVKADIRTRSPSYAALAQPQPLSLRQIQRELDPDTLLLEYSLGPTVGYLWAVTPTSLQSYALPSRGVIEAAAKDFRTFLADKTPQDFDAAAAKLSSMLLWPVASELKKKRLIVVADGLLQAYVPFAALPSPTAREGKSLLIREHEILHEPSASAVVALRQSAAGRQPPSKVVAVFADPIFSPTDERLAAGATGEQSLSLLREAVDSTTGGEGLVRLRHAREEAKSILALSTPAQSLSRLDFDASKAAAEDPELAAYRIVHFATHGLLDQKNPGLSGLVFSLFNKDGQRVDGYLRLNEIFNLTFPVSLVVLSACESGQGQRVRGEGLVGLTRGFMYAGAMSLAVSLWLVDDAATAELMARFYREMLGPDLLRPAGALRKAQLSMLDEGRWSQPFYWAPFIVEGDWR